MKIKYNINAKIEYSTRKLDSQYNTDRKHREVFYRIVPSELSFFKRIFCNPWRQIYKAFTYFTGATTLYTPKEYSDMVKQVKTFGEMCNYIDEQHRLINQRYTEIRQKHLEAVERGEEWED